MKSLLGNKIQNGPYPLLSCDSQALIIIYHFQHLLMFFFCKDTTTLNAQTFNTCSLLVLSGLAVGAGLRTLHRVLSCETPTYHH